jgi:hypothetical protein
MALEFTQNLTKWAPEDLSVGKARPARKMDYLASICEQIVLKMKATWHLTTLLASAAFYRDSFTLFNDVDVVLELILFSILIEATRRPESREYGRRYSSRWSRGTVYLQEFTLTSPTSGGRFGRCISLAARAAEFSFIEAIKTFSLIQGFHRWHVYIYHSVEF